MAGRENHGYTGSGSMNVSQDALQFNTCDEPGRMKPRYVDVYGEAKTKEEKSVFC